MPNPRIYLAHLTGVRSYEARIAFTNSFEPVTIARNGLPFPSLKIEILANSLSPKAIYLHKIYGRIPYSAPIYLWERQQKGKREILYIGQTVSQSIQKRFEKHASVAKLLAQYVNDPLSYIYYRLCSRLDIVSEKNGSRSIRAIEHFPLGQARKIIDDVEAYLIYQYKPKFNSQYKNKKKRYWKPFLLTQIMK